MISTITDSVLAHPDNREQKLGEALLSFNPVQNDEVVLLT